MSISKATTIDVITGYEPTKEQLAKRESLSDYNNNNSKKIKELTGRDKIEHDITLLSLESLNARPPKDFKQLVVDYIMELNNQPNKNIKE